MTACDIFADMAARYPHFAVECRMTGSPPDRLGISLLDSLDTDTSSGFVKGIESLMRSTPTLKSITVDASKVRYLSSTGLGALATVYLASQKRNIDFCLTNPSSHVEMLLNLLGFDLFIPVSRDMNPA